MRLTRGRSVAKVRLGSMPMASFAGKMQLDPPFPLTPALSLGEREHRRPARVGGTAWCIRPQRVEEAKAGSPLRSAPALHRVELQRSGLGQSKDVGDRCDKAKIVPTFSCASLKS